MFTSGLFIFSVIIFIIYYTVILYLKQKFQNYQTPNTGKAENHYFTSIIIVGRNEEKNIEKCINSILSNNFDQTKYEIIFVDDFSTDNSINILNQINSPNLKIYELKDYLKSKQIFNFKKNAIDLAISKSKGDIIIQTDADTIVSTDWINAHVSNFGENPNSLNTGPVFYDYGNDFLTQFQYYDILTTIGVTCAGIASKKFYLANGANMSYRRDLYLKIFPENFNFASGDDVFFIQAINKLESTEIKFLKTKSAIVKTRAAETLVEFKNQRLRWGSKTMRYKDNWLISLIILVFITNLFILKYLLIGIIFWNFLNGFLLFVFIKLIVDISFIRNISKFFDLNINFSSLIISLLNYPFYIVTIGFLSLIQKKYNWKGKKCEIINTKNTVTGNNCVF